MKRRKAREVALQSLYQIDVGGVEAERAINQTLEINETSPDYISFTRELVFGTIEHLGVIDKIIADLSKDWNLERLARVDHNIMRMAIFEIMYRDDIPYRVTVNEAVELSKTFGGEDSKRFVNGILGMVVKNGPATDSGVKIK